MLTSLLQMQFQELLSNFHFLGEHVTPEFLDELHGIIATHGTSKLFTVHIV